MKKLVSVLFTIALTGFVFVPSGNAQCCGDCNYSGVVTIDNLITAVNNSLFECPPGSNNIDLPNSTPDEGNILKEGGRFIHNFGDNNTFVGEGAGNFTMRGFANTATGAFALLSNTVGFSNTATGATALFHNSTGNRNTATGAHALERNTAGGSNTATGNRALWNNMRGDRNTATGNSALRNNDTGGQNTATGDSALRNNATGFNNTATGFFALSSNIDGDSNTATGVNALRNNLSADSNTAIGFGALFNNTNGDSNTATGRAALIVNTTGGFNTAIGRNALRDNTTGSNNTAVGAEAGALHAAGDNNIYISHIGNAAEDGTIRIGMSETQTRAFIAGVVDATSAGGVPVLINGEGQLGTMMSSRRFKEDVQDMAAASSALSRLRPVTFRYKSEYDDGSGLQQYGLVAEEVAEVYPGLVQYAETGEPLAVRYHLVNAMLLNEVQRQQRAIHRQHEEIRELNTRLARLEALAMPGTR